MPESRSRRRWTTPLILATIAGLSVNGLAFTPAHAAEQPIEFASLLWGLNGTSQGAAPAGGCDYFVAGISDGTAATYKTVDEDVYVVKQSSGGDLSAVTASNRCSNSNGSTIGQRLYFSGGEGQRTDDGSVEISWQGSATVNAYGGLVPWYIENPVLTLDADGDGTVTASVGGFASSMANPGTKEPLEPRSGVTIATVSDANSNNADGFTVTPVYAGVDYYPLVEGERSATSAISDSAKAGNPAWGSWPESFVDFQYTTGLSSYWHTSGGAADAKKPPLPITVDYVSSVPAFAGVAPTITTTPANVQAVAGDDVELTVVADGTDLRYQWKKRDENFDYVDLVGETAATLTLADASTENSYGLYKVEVSNDLGSTESSAIEVRVEEAAPVEVHTNPSEARVAEGGSFSFSGGASGYPDATYQWQRSTNGADWTDIGEASTTQGITVDAATLEQDGTLYRFFASNGYGETKYSEPASVRVAPLEGPGFVTLPSTVLDPTVENKLQLLAAQFPAAAPQSFIVTGVVDTSVFDPAAPLPNKMVKFALVGSTVYNTWATGSFETSVTLPANSLDPAKNYALVSYTYPTASPAFVTSTPLTFGTTTGLEVTSQPATTTAVAGSAASLSATVSGVPAPTWLQWQRSIDGTWTDVAGATKSTLEFPAIEPAQAGDYRLVARRGIDVVRSAAASVTVTQPQSPIEQPSVTPTLSASPTPTISGTPVVGSTLRAKTGTWDAGVTLSYRWLANNRPIAGAGKSSLKVTSSLRNKVVRVEVTGSKTGFETATRLSPGSAKVAALGTVTVSGATKVGRTLKAKTSKFTSGSTFSYVWQRDGKTIKGAKSATLKVKAAYRGDRITVKVRATKKGYASVTVASKASKTVKR